MNLGENLQNLRKKENISQELLAEKLNVSRQAISKWESGECYPETEKLIKLCDIFKCSMNDLIKGKILESNETEKNKYESLIKKFSIGVSLGVFLILLGITIFLLTISKNKINELNEETILIGVVILLLFCLIAIPIFIILGLEMNNYKQKNKVLPEFYTEKEIDKFNKKFAISIAISVSTIF